MIERTRCYSFVCVVLVLLMYFLVQLQFMACLKVMNFHGVLAKFHEKNRLISFSSSEPDCKLCFISLSVLQFSTPLIPKKKKEIDLYMSI